MDMLPMVAVLTGLFIGQPAISSSIGPASAGWIDQPVAVDADGAFRVSGEDPFADIRGLPVASLGSVLTAQTILRFSACRYTEYLIVADCDNVQVIEIQGARAPEIGEGIDERSILAHRSVENLVYAGGPVGLDRDTSLQAISAAAEAYGVDVRLDLMDRIAQMLPHNRFDPFIGCKIYYPDSAGARL